MVLTEDFHFLLNLGVIEVPWLADAMVHHVGVVIFLVEVTGVVPVSGKIPLRSLMIALDVLQGIGLDVVRLLAKTGYGGVFWIISC